MRRFWIPVLQLQDLPAPGGEPKPIEIMGERLVAWRDAQGRRVDGHAAQVFAQARPKPRHIPPANAQGIDQAHQFGHVIKL